MPPPSDAAATTGPDPTRGRSGNIVVNATVGTNMARAPLPLESGLGFRLDRLVRTMRTAWAGDLSSIGLTPPQAAVLRGVADTDGISIRALARLLGGDPMNVKRCVDEVEQRGLLASGTAEGDRRPRVLTLTEEGRAVVVKVDRLVHAQDARLTEAVGAPARPEFERALGALERVHGIAQVGGDGDDGSLPETAAASPDSSPRRSPRSTSSQEKEPHP